MTAPASGLGHAAGILRRPEAPPAAFLGILLVFLSLTIPSFGTGGNLYAILRQAAPVAVVALAVNQLILSGQIDISMGSMVAALAFVFALPAESMGAPWLAFGLAVAAGAGLGAINGLLVVVARIPAIIATLGTLMIVRGLLFVFAGNVTLYASDATRIFGNGRIGALTVDVLILALAAGVFAWMSAQTRLGRDALAVGGNARAARDVGIAVGRVHLISFALVGLTCGIAAAMFIGQVAAMQANVAGGFELRVLAAVVLGGTSLSGGRGSVVAPLVGALLLSVILNATALLRLPPTFEQLILGVILLTAIAIMGLRARLLEDDA